MARVAPGFVTMEREEWLAQVREEVLEPQLPICDPHHHLWDYPQGRYLLDELLADVGSGHNVVSTVFMECGSMYRADGAEALRPVGETEFVNGIAAMSASGGYGPVRAFAAFATRPAGTPATRFATPTRRPRRECWRTRRSVKALRNSASGT